MYNKFPKVNYIGVLGSKEFDLNRLNRDFEIYKEMKKRDADLYNDISSKIECLSDNFRTLFKNRNSVGKHKVNINEYILEIRRLKKIRGKLI